jgi:hypothetical protein
MNKQKILENFVIKQINKVRDLFIIQLENNKHMLFDKFIVTQKNKTLFQITYQHRTGLLTLHNIKYAITYCIYENIGKYNEANVVLELDRKIENCYSNIDYYKRLCRTKVDRDTKLLYLTKLNEYIFRKKSYEDEIQKHINMSRYWLNKKYEESIV